MKIVAVILAGGSGNRFGGDKTLALLGRKPLWRWSFETFLNHPQINAVGIVASKENIEAIRAEVPEAAFVVLGGATRQESSRQAVEACDGDILLVHDAARPFIDEATISRVIEGIIANGAAAAGSPVTDTIKQRDGQSWQTLARNNLIAMQTPQGARKDLLQRAHQEVKEECTDDMAMLEKIGISPTIVEGATANFKVTLAEDLARARQMIGTPETRTGLGYDIHAFSADPSRILMLGGVAFPGERALDGHSDADVLLHAAVDALLGAAALGDIGRHFPNTDPRWRGEPSLTFLRHAAELLSNEGWQILHLDIAVMAETPKIMPRAVEMRQTIASALNLDLNRVSIKATTNEGLGAIGRCEGIAAFATATIREKP